MTRNTLYFRVQQLIFDRAGYQEFKALFGGDLQKFYDWVDHEQLYPVDVDYLHKIGKDWESNI